MTDMVFEYKGDLYPSYLRDGNMMQFIEPIASQFCKGKGLDIGSGKWPFSDARPIDIKNGDDAMNLPIDQYDYLISSHCLEHLPDPVSALEHWRTRLWPGGVLFLYLPHPDQIYWRPQHCRKHLHTFHPKDVAQMMRDLGFVNVMHSERDLAWSFSCVGWAP